MTVLRMNFINDSFSTNKTAVINAFVSWAYTEGVMRYGYS